MSRQDLPLDEYLALELARRTERCLRLEQEKAELQEQVETLRALVRTHERARFALRPVPLARRMGGE